MKKIKQKSVAYYFDDGVGGLMAVTKTSVTQMKKNFSVEPFAFNGKPCYKESQVADN